MITRVLAVLLGYFLGCFPTGYVVGKRRGVDIRKHGSGNTGATNTPSIVVVVSVVFGLLVLSLSVVDSVKLCKTTLIVFMYHSSKVPVRANRNQ